MSEEGSRVHEIFDRVHANHAELPACRVKDFVIADQRARVGCGNFGCQLARADLEDDDGLASCSRAVRCSRKSSRILDRFCKDHDDFRVDIIDEKVDARGNIDHCLVARGDEQIHAQIALVRELHDLAVGRAALRDEAG